MNVLKFSGFSLFTDKTYGSLVIYDVYITVVSVVICLYHNIRLIVGLDISILTSYFPVFSNTNGYIRILIMALEWSGNSASRPI